ncbi:FxLYD domain-containing protein [Halobacillus seohaensis]|uniref:FxLYD domain-containing protein n=1 Tax=Halobacillus seohaensis TaxID=447421 RepID=A0ABW2ER52_9BACI
MNKFAKVLGISVLSASVLAACGSEDATMSSDDNNGTEQQEDQKGQEEEEVEEEQAEAAVEVQSETFGARKDSIDNVYGSYSAVITNTGDKPAMIGDVQVNFEGEGDTIIGTAAMVSAVPDVIMPGEVAYLGVSKGLESATSADEVTDVSVNIDFDSTNEEPMMLETTSVEVKEGSHYPYVVTGTVMNPNKEKADDIRLAAGLYDENGEFLGTLNGSIQVSLNQDGKAGFELNYPELPEDVAGKASEVKVKAYNWSF